MGPESEEQSPKELRVGIKSPKGDSAQVKLEDSSEESSVDDDGVELDEMAHGVSTSKLVGTNNQN